MWLPNTLGSTTSARAGASPAPPARSAAAKQTIRKIFEVFMLISCKFYFLPCFTAFPPD
jgi:hypothetical protein